MVIQMWIESGTSFSCDDLIEELPNSAAAQEIKRLREQRDALWALGIHDNMSRPAALNSEQADAELSKAVKSVRQLQAFVEKMPKCWRLNESGELTQDAPVHPGMRLWQSSDDDPHGFEGWEVLSVGCQYGTTKQRYGWVLTNGLGEITTSVLYDSPDAAKAAKAAKS